MYAVEIPTHVPEFEPETGSELADERVEGQALARLGGGTPTDVSDRAGGRVAGAGLLGRRPALAVPRSRPEVEDLDASLVFEHLLASVADPVDVGPQRLGRRLRGEGGRQPARQRFRARPEKVGRGEPHRRMRRGDSLSIVHVPGSIAQDRPHAWMLGPRARCGSPTDRPTVKPASVDRRKRSRPSGGAF